MDFTLPQRILGAVVLAVGIYACGYFFGWAHSHDDLIRYRAEVETLGKQQIQQNKLREIADKLAKEKSDEKLKNELADSADIARRLYNARSRSGYLLTTSTAASNPGVACFNRADLDAAIRQLDEGVQGLVVKGDSSRVGLDSVREWAKSR